MTLRRTVGRLIGSPSSQLAFGSLVSRLTLLALLVGAARILGTEDYYVLAYALAVSAGSQTLLDPGSTNWLVGRWTAASTDQRRDDWHNAVALHGAFMGVLVLVTAVAGVTAGGEDTFVVAVGIGVIAACEGLARASRSPWLAQRRVDAYVRVDLAIAALRVSTLGALFVSDGDLGTYTVANFVAGSLILVSVGLMRRELGGPVGFAVRPRRTLRSMWPYSTFLPALYAQLPVIIVGLVGTLEVAAVYGVLVRMVQSTELVPAAIASAGLPNLVESTGRARTEVFRAQAQKASLIAVICAVALIAVSPVLLPTLGIGLDDGFVVLVLLAATLIPKFLSYQLVSLCVAENTMRKRFAASAVVATFSVVLTGLAAQTGAAWVAATSLSSEILLCALLLLANRGRLVMSDSRVGASA